MKKAFTSALQRIPQSRPRLTPRTTALTRMSSTQQPKPDSDNNSQPQQKAPAAGSIPVLPAPREGETITLDVSGDGATVKLDHIGPLVVNHDGTMSRIGNWAEMSPPEKKNTLRILGKRNQQRLKKLREASGEAEAAGNPGKEE
ncbi:hypothetical protein IMZ48_22920 [Candidatus Bathyarchaeota archaeon]|nr:hypothetical protein [Candidatus Bathyarchaeota archaeon]